VLVLGEPFDSEYAELSIFIADLSSGKIIRRAIGRLRFV
jgi:hypothetical protein